MKGEHFIVKQNKWKCDNKHILKTIGAIYRYIDNVLSMDNPIFENYTNDTYQAH